MFATVGLRTTMGGQTHNGIQLQLLIFWKSSRFLFYWMPTKKDINCFHFVVNYPFLLLYSLYMVEICYSLENPGLSTGGHLLRGSIIRQVLSNLVIKTITIKLYHPSFRPDVQNPLCYPLIWTVILLGKLLDSYLALPELSFPCQKNIIILLFK